jgi:hypothetical protein
VEADSEKEATVGKIEIEAAKQSHFGTLRDTHE